MGTKTAQERIRMGFSLHEAVRHWATYTPEKPLLINEHLHITYREIQEKIIKIRAVLSARHLEPQTPIGLLMDDKPIYLASLCAILSEGHSVVILNVAIPGNLLANMIHDCQCPLLLTHETLLEKARQIDCDQILVDRMLQQTPTTFDPAPFRNPENYNPRYLDQIWGTIYSSGTTGQPKGVVRTDLSILSELIGWCFEIPIVRSSTIYISRPIYYTGGLVLSAAAMLAGASIIAPVLHSEINYHDLLSRHSVSMAFMLPSEVDQLIQARIASSLPWPAPEKILTMGAPTSVTLKKLTKKWLHCDYIESWGNSEGLGTITDPDDVERRPKSIGRPFLTDRMFILNDKREIVQNQEIGLISGIADSNFSEYRNRSDLNQEAINDDRVISEDLGHIDPDGYFYIVGRTVDRMIRNGHVVFTSDIERAMLQTENFEAAKVVAIERPGKDAIPVAAVVLKPSITKTPEDLLQDIHSLLPPEQHVSSILIVNQLPMNAAGKVDLNAVRALFCKDGANSFQTPTNQGIKS
ncbi:MAG: acyl--CoA ligase [Magnetococcales bacterium]|nr:acyl--CoA ligase [Magnetococcales bacterium]